MHVVESRQGMISTGCLPAIRAHTAMDCLVSVVLIGDAATVRQEAAHCLGKPLEAAWVAGINGTGSCARGGAGSQPSVREEG